MLDRSLSGRLFDLNIEEVLEHWKVEHALREIIANALDEQFLSGSAEIEIFENGAGDWHVRDHGRGLRIEHFTLNENHEKLASESQVIGKFGVGLKDALATLHRRGVGVTIRSPFGTFRLREAPKHDFHGITTLHVEHGPTPGENGTDFVLTDVSRSDMEAAQALFLRFNDDVILDETPYGQVLRHAGGPPRVYINGVLANEEPNFLFSYNITSLTSAMKKRLNRERTNVGRTTYAERVKAILRTAESEEVGTALADQVSARARGDQCDEMQWIEIAQRALNLLHDRDNVTFVTEWQLEAAPDIINHMRSDGYDVVVVSDAQKAKLDDQYESGDSNLRTFEGYIDEYNSSFEYEFVEPDALLAEERAQFDRSGEILALIALTPATTPPILISETMRVGLDSTNGVWDPALRSIVIARRQLARLDAYAATLLHEAAHATTGAPDVSRHFESVLTEYLGVLSLRCIDRECEVQTPAPTPIRETDLGGSERSPWDSWVCRCRVGGWLAQLRNWERVELASYRAREADAAKGISEFVLAQHEELKAVAKDLATRATEYLHGAASREPALRSWHALADLLVAKPADEDAWPGSIGIVRRDLLDESITDPSERLAVIQLAEQAEARIESEWHARISSLRARNSLKLAELSEHMSVRTASIRERSAELDAIQAARAAAESPQA